MQIQETSAKYKKQVQKQETSAETRKTSAKQEIIAETRNVRCFRHTTNFCRICADPRVSERVNILVCLDTDDKVPQIQ